MAVMKKKGNKEIPGISTGSLPDIVFMLLFFFMVTTTMRETELKVKFTLPTATEIQKLENKSLVSYIYVGKPTDDLRGRFGDAPRIQLNDSYRSAVEIGEFIASEKDKLNELDRAKMTVSIKADHYVKMGIITDIKQELRRAQALKISYVSSKVLSY